MTKVSTLSVAQGRLTGTGDSAVWDSVQPRLESYIQQELAKLPTPSQPGISQEKAEEIVRNAIQALNLPSSFLTENRVNELVQTAINALPTPAPGITEQRVTELINQAVGRLPAPGTSEERAKQLIADALEELKRAALQVPEVSAASRALPVHLALQAPPARTRTWTRFGPSSPPRCSASCRSLREWTKRRRSL